MIELKLVLTKCKLKCHGVLLGLSIPCFGEAITHGVSLGVHGDFSSIRESYLPAKKTD